MAIGVPLSAIRLGRAAESKMKQDAMKGKGAAADNSSSRVKFSKSSEVFKQLVMPPPLLHRHYHICTSLAVMAVETGSSTLPTGFWSTAKGASS